MSLFDDIPIKRKVVWVILLSSMITLLLALAAMFVFQWFQIQKTIAADLMTQAEIVAANSTAALSFQDAPAANEILSALKAKPRILCACIYLPDRTRFAHFGAPENMDELPPNPVPDGIRFEGPHLVLFQPIQLDSKRLGTLYLRYDFRAIQRKTIAPYLAILGFILPASLVLALVLSSALQRVISVPVLRLAETAKAVAEHEDYSVRADYHSRDELGLLTSAFNQMLARIEANDRALRKANLDLHREMAERQRAQVEIEDLNRQMQDVSHRAGMAEIATGVLHNIGNVLNSVNVASSLVSERLRRSKISSLGKVAQLFEQHSADLGTFMSQDPKGRQLPGYLNSLAAFLTQEREFLLKEMDLLRDSVDHIKGILTTQQSYAKVSGTMETVQLTDLVDDAVKLNVGTLARRGVQVTKDYATLPALPVERHKVLQILINLIRNAMFALDESGREDKRLLLKTGFGGKNRVRIEVVDNGIGIPAENLPRIFSHGFTTRSNGHGFGLHSGLSAAREMGGSLTVCSDGPGRGATFTLELPLVREPQP